MGLEEGIEDREACGGLGTDRLKPVGFGTRPQPVHQADVWFQWDPGEEGDACVLAFDLEALPGCDSVPQSKFGWQGELAVGSDGGVHEGGKQLLFLKFQMGCLVSAIHQGQLEVYAR